MTKEELATERNEVREILEDFSEELSQSNLDKLSRVFCLINGDEKRIADLEKENAELKLKLETLEGQTPWKDIKDKSEVIGQLTKAKELIREIIDTPVFNQMGGELYENEGYTELVEEAEQFLKDSEVEK